MVETGRPGSMNDRRTMSRAQRAMSRAQRAMAPGHLFVDVNAVTAGRSPPAARGVLKGALAPRRHLFA